MKEVKNEHRGSSGKHFFLIMSILVMVISVSMFTGCGGSSSDDSDDDSSSSTTSSSSDSDTDSYDISDLEDDDYDASDYDVPDSGIVDITFNTNSISGATSGASAVDTTLTISSAGTYRMTGDLTDGRIIVETEDEDVVRLIFNGIDVTCSESAPFYVSNAERTAIILADDTDNYLTDPDTYTYFDDSDEEEPNAALHSRDYLTIGVPTGGAGTGTLTVTGLYNDGITSKDGMIIDGGTITVSAPDDGIRGKDYLLVKDGTLNVTTTGTGDGLLSDNEEDTERGYILIEKGNVNIDAQGDAIQAETYVVVYDGVFNLISGGGAGTSFNEEDSKKGIKGVAGVQIDGGDFTIDSADDAVHSNGFIVANDGIFDMATGDDAMHADATLEAYGGDYNISESYEGIESSVITIGDGNFYIVSSDDALNVAGGNDGSGMDGPGGGFTPGETGDYYLYIDGGYLALYAGGDGLDSNGSIEMTAGTVLVHGPTSDGNGALDYVGSFSITGGLLVAAGSSGMAEAPGTSSTQYSVLLNFSEESAGTLFHIETEGEEEILTFRPSKRYESIVFSSSALSNGTSYHVYSGGSADGTVVDGLYTGGTYTPGTYESSLDFTIESVVTTVGDGGGMPPVGG